MAEDKTDYQVSDCSFTSERADASEGTRSDEEMLSDISVYGKSPSAAAIARLIPEAKNDEVRDQLRRLVSAINRTIPFLDEATRSLISHNSFLQGHIEGTSALLEWIFPDFRIGFNIEPNPKESGCCILSNKNLNDMVQVGSLDQIDDIIVSLLAFIGHNT
jgi:hypothetical protein